MVKNSISNPTRHESLEMCLHSTTRDLKMINHYDLSTIITIKAVIPDPTSVRKEFLVIANP